MWQNYLTVGLRSLIKNKTYAFINIFGLALGLAACLMILLYVRYERSYDDWLPGARDIYQLQNFSTDRETGEVYGLQQSQYVAGTALKKDFPEVRKLVYATGGYSVALRGGEAVAIEDSLAVNGPFFDVVPLPLLRGNPATALARPQSVVLTQTEAERLFGGEEAYGKTLTVVSRGERIDLRVTGILKDIPRNSSFRLSMISRFDPTAFFSDYPGYMTAWGEIGGWNFVRLAPGTDVARIHAAMPAWEKRNIAPIDTGSGKLDPAEFADWRLVSLRDVHLGEAQSGSMTPGNDAGTILTFSIVGLLILFMACINFTNLATARASQRAREVALRKVLGATRKQLIVQFIGESILVTTLSMLLAMAIVELTLPALSAFLEADLKLSYFGDGGVIGPVLLLVLLVGAAGGLYPAFYISRFRPASILRANQSSEGSSVRLRSILVVVQFAISIGLIICTAIIYSQSVFARTADPGFRRDGVLEIANLQRKQLQPLHETLAREIGRVEGVTSVARTSIGVSTKSNMGRSVYVEGRPDPINIGNYPVDENFFRTMGIDLIAGRGFDPNRPADRMDVETSPEVARALAARGGNAVINELAARRLGFANPARAVGKQVRVLLGVEQDSGLVPVTIIGVVKDTRFRSIRQPLDPIMYRLSNDYLSTLAVRYESTDPAAVRARIEQAWKRIAPDVPFQAEFTGDVVEELYGQEAARAQIFAAFAGLSVVVGCLGLFGLAVFTAERRTKEIGIRKVLGARSADIVRLLAWQFSKPVIVANLVAWPVAWWVMRDWLNNFDTRIALGPEPFLLAGLLALLIAIGTVAGHAIRIARTNPIHALRYE